MMNETVAQAEAPERKSDSILDAFARENVHSVPATVPGIGAMGAVEERIVGAQRIAVHRDEEKVLRKLRVLASAAGEDWYYRFPVKRKQKDGGFKTEHIEGPTIKCANNVARLYGNCDVDCRVFDLGDSWVFYARFVDLETGFSLTRPFQQRKAQKTLGTADAGRALDIAFQIGASKAIRNVVCNALETFTAFAFDEAKNSLIEKIGKRLDDYRGKVVRRLEEMGVPVARVEAERGRPAPQWLAPDIAYIIAEIQAVQDGMATIEETWPTAGDAGVAPAEGDAKVDTLKDTKAEKKSAKPRKAKEQQAKSEASGDNAKDTPKDAGTGTAGKDAETEPDYSAWSPERFDDERQVLKVSIMAAKNADDLDALLDLRARIIGAMRARSPENYDFVQRVIADKRKELGQAG